MSEPAYIDRTSYYETLATGSNNIYCLTPTARQPGDILIASIIFHSPSAANVVTKPSDWTTLTYDDINGDATTSLGIYYHVVTSDTAASYYWTRDSTGDFAYLIEIICLRPVQKFSPIHAYGSQVNDSKFNEAPSLSPAIRDCMLVYIGGDPNGRTYTLDGTMTERWEDRYYDGTHDISQCGGTEIFASTGPTGTRTGTLNANSICAAALIAIAPSGPPIVIPVLD